MLIECQKCGAPLDADGSKRFVECRYCGLSNKVASSRTLMMQTPADWRPPVQWTPQVQGHVAGAAMAGGASAAGIGLTGCISAFVVSVVLGALGVAFFAFGSPFAGSGAEMPLGLGPSWDGSAPFSCSMNEDVRIEGVIANLPGQTAITAGLNCDVTLVNAVITAGRGIDASGNGIIRLENSTIRSTGVGIAASQNKRVVLVNSQVVAGSVGVEARQNADVTIEGGRVEGSPRAVVTGRNGELVNRGATLVDRP